MLLNILMIGDVVGRPGRVAICRQLPGLIARLGVDFTVVNAENVSEGSGITPALFEKILAAGADVCTMGDHAFRRRESYGLYERSPRIVRPANLPEGAVGKGVTVQRTKAGVPVAVAAIMGQLHMKPSPDSPFLCADRLLAALPADTAVRLIDFHAEITAEKGAFGRYLAGRVSAVVGTHTHVPTADEQILPGGTAYVTDLGMTGPHDSVLGRRTDRVVKSLVTGMPQTYDVAEGDPRLTGVLIRVDAQTGKASHIERIQVKDEGAADNAGE